VFAHARTHVCACAHVCMRVRARVRVRVSCVEYACAVCERGSFLCLEYFCQCECFFSLCMCICMCRELCKYES